MKMTLKSLTEKRMSPRLKRRARAIRWGSHISVHRAILGSFPVTGILELGAGLYSTPEFFKTDKKVVSIESDCKWIDRIKPSLSETEQHRLIHHSIDPKITIGTSYKTIPDEIFQSSLEFYRSHMSSNLNMMFIDHYDGLRLSSLQSLYGEFGVVTYHDAHTPENFGYQLFKNDRGYIRYLDKSFIAYTGILINPDWASFIPSFLDLLKVETEKRADALNVVAALDISEIKL